MSAPWPDHSRRDEAVRQEYPEDYADQANAECARPECGDHGEVVTPDGALCERHARLLAASMELGGDHA